MKLKLSINMLAIIYLAITVLFSNLVKAEDSKALKESFNHLTYHLALLKEGFNPTDVKESMTKTLILERVPEVYVPLYKRFYNLSEELDINFNQLHKKDNQKKKQTDLDIAAGKTIEIGTKIVAAVADPTGMAGISLLSSLLGQSDESRNISERESLEKYKINNKKLISDYEFDLRLSRKNIPKDVEDSKKLSLSDVSEFINIQKINDANTYSKLVKLNAGIEGFYPLTLAIATLELSNKDIKSGIDNLKITLEELPTILNNKKVKADVYQMLAFYTFVSKGNIKEIKFYNGLLGDLDPLNPVYLMIEGAIHFDENKVDEGLSLLRQSVKYSEKKHRVAGLNVGILCGFLVNEDCELAIDKSMKLDGVDIKNWITPKVKETLKATMPKTYNKVFELQFLVSMDWHLVQKDRILIKNISNEKWTGIIAGSFYNEYGKPSYRADTNQWYKYNDVGSGQQLQIRTAASTKIALENISLHIWTDQGNVIIELNNRGDGVFNVKSYYGKVKKTW
jgi:hypothetical protein